MKNNQTTTKPDYQQYLDANGYTIKFGSIYMKKDDPRHYSLLLGGLGKRPNVSAINVDNLSGGSILIGSLRIMQQQVDSGELFLKTTKSPMPMETKSTIQPEASEVDLSCLVLMAENLQRDIKAQADREWSLVNEHRHKAEALNLAFREAESYVYQLKKKITPAHRQP